MATYKSNDLKTKLDTAFADNTSGDITAKVIRDNLNHIADSIPVIVASGSNPYFMNNVVLRGSGLSTGITVGRLKGQWNKQDVASIDFVSGADATNKDDGHIHFKTSTESSNPKKRMSIRNDGRVFVHGSGTQYPALTVESLHGSGLNILLQGSSEEIAYPSGTSFHLGEWDSDNTTFNPRLVVNSRGWIGSNIKYPEDMFHVRGSGRGLRVDSYQNSGSDLMMSRFKTSEAFVKDNYYLGFGIGVDTPASGLGRMFIGVDNDRDYRVGLNDHVFVIDSGGRASFGSSHPSEKLVVGQDLGSLTSDGNAVVVSSTTGDSQLFVASGVNSANKKFLRVAWQPEYNNAKLSVNTGYEHKNQLVLHKDGNVGVGASGVQSKSWTPKSNFHVTASGTSPSVAFENAMDKGIAIYVGKNTLGSGLPVHTGTINEIGQWSSIGYEATGEVLKINNSGTLGPNHLTITRLGQVGINTASPSTATSIGTNRLHVDGDNSAVIVGNSAGGTNSALRLVGSRSTNNTAYVQAGTSAADTNAKLAISRFDTDSTNVSEVSIYSDKTTMHGNLALNDKWLSNDGGDEGIKVSDAGNVAIGKTPGSTYAFELNSGRGAQPTSTLWINTSDERVKEEISTLDTSDALNKILQLRPVKFKYIQEFCDSTKSDHEEFHFNFLAQEVESIFPCCVIETDSNIVNKETGETVVSNVKGLDANAINIHLVAAGKELKSQLDIALTRISVLESS